MSTPVVSTATPFPAAEYIPTPVDPKAILSSSNDEPTGCISLSTATLPSDTSKTFLRFEAVPPPTAKSAFDSLSLNLPRANCPFVPTTVPSPNAAEFSAAA